MWPFKKNKQISQNAQINRCISTIGLAAGIAGLYSSNLSMDNLVNNQKNPKTRCEYCDAWSEEDICPFCAGNKTVDNSQENLKKALENTNQEKTYLYADNKVVMELCNHPMQTVSCPGIPTITQCY